MTPVWTPARIAQAVALAHLPRREAAAMMDVTCDAYKGALERQRAKGVLVASGIRRDVGVWRERAGLFAMIKAMIEEGKSCRQAGAWLGLTKNQVVGKMWRMAKIASVSKSLEERLAACENGIGAGCRYTIGYPEPGWQYCGEKITGPGRSFCYAHWRECYIAVREHAHA